MILVIRLLRITLVHFSSIKVNTQHRDSKSNPRLYIIRFLDAAIVVIEEILEYKDEDEVKTEPQFT